MTAGPPNTASPSAFTCLLRGTLDEFLPYIGQEQSKWLIDISHDICDPARKRGSLKVWDVSGEGWRDVNPTDPPTASTYLYVTWAVVSLTKISDRVGKSETSSGGDASAMANRVKQRDVQECWVTRGFFPISNGHICPKRMGDNLLRVVYKTFVSSPPPPALSIYDEICGITLSRTLDDWFDIYELGLRLVAPVRSSLFFPSIFYAFLIFYDELRISTYAIRSFNKTGHRTGDAQYTEAGHRKPSPHTYPLYMGTRLVLLNPNMPATPRLVCCDGTIYSALFESLPILTIKTCKTSTITSCRLKWKVTQALRLKALTASVSGLQLLWTVGEPRRW